MTPGFQFTDQRAEKMQDDSDGQKVNGHMPEQKEAKEVIWVIGTSLSHSASRDCAEVYDLKQALFFCNSLTQQLQKLVLFGIF